MKLKKFEKQIILKMNYPTLQCDEFKKAPYKA